MISVITVSWNPREGDLAELRELFGACREAAEIVVVDNGSDEPVEAKLGGLPPGVRVVRAERNRGYSAGVNVGLREAQGDVLVILNPDTLPEPQAVARLAEAVRSHPETVLFGGTIVDGQGHVDPCSARELPTLTGILWEGVFLPKPRTRAYGHTVRNDVELAPVPAVSGAAMALSRAAFERLGPMNEEYFLYDEDLEWCARAGELGGVAVVPGARIRHQQGSTSRRSEGRPFTARMLSDFQYFVEFRGKSARSVRWRWRLRQQFRTLLYALDARFGAFGRRPNSPARVRIYGDLARAAGRLRWTTSAEVQNAHPDRLPELSGVPVPTGTPDRR